MMKSYYVDTAEGQIHYRTQGSGEPLLLLAQVPLSSDSYLEMIPLLGKHLRVVAMDTPGYGQSYVPPEGYLVEDYARSIIHFLDALDIDKSSIFGHHTGATLAVEVAAAHPERVDKLVLSGCPYFEPAAREAQRADPICAAMEIREDGTHLKEWWQTCRSGLPYLNPETCLRVLVDYLRAGLGARAEDAHKAIFLYDIEWRLPLIQSPTLLISGTGDSFYGRLQATKNLIPRCRTMIVEGSRNVPAWEKPVEFVQATLDFLESPMT